MFKNVEFEIWFPILFMRYLGIKWFKLFNVRLFLLVELSGLHENIQNFYPRCSGSFEIGTNKVTKVIADNL